MLRRTIIVTAFATGLASASTARAAETHVSFASPEGFTDIDTEGSSLTVRATLDRIQQVLADLGRRLPVDQVLDIQVTDVDLAGLLLPPRQGMSSQRVLTDNTRPAIRMGYRLSRGGRVLASGQENVTDPTYLQNGTTHISSDTLRYEAAMLERWFGVRFGRFTSGPRVPPAPNEVGFKPRVFFTESRSREASSGWGRMRRLRAGHATPRSGGRITSVPPVLRPGSAPSVVERQDLRPPRRTRDAPRGSGRELGSAEGEVQTIRTEKPRRKSGLPASRRPLDLTRVLSGSCLNHEARPAGDGEPPADGAWAIRSSSRRR